MDDSPAAGTPRQRATGVARWYLLAALVVVLDQWSKWAVLRSFAPGERLALLPGTFDLTLLFNTGAAFSMFAGAGGWQRWLFMAIGTAAATAIGMLLRRHREDTLFSLALALIMGGAAGNVIDRIRLGKVVDFLLAYHDSWYFPAFNLADSAITAGAIALVVDELLRIRRARRAATH